MWRLLLGTMGIKSLVQGLNTAATARFEPRTVWSEVRRRNRLATALPKERLRRRRLAAHHRWVTFFWKKLQVRKWHSLKTLQAYSLNISLLHWPKTDPPQDKKKNSLSKNFCPLFGQKIPSPKTFVPMGDFTTWTDSIGDVNHFLVSLIVVRHFSSVKQGLKQTRSEYTKE